MRHRFRKDLQIQRGLHIPAVKVSSVFHVNNSAILVYAIHPHNSTVELNKISVDNSLLQFWSIKLLL